MWPWTPLDNDGDDRQFVVERRRMVDEQMRSRGINDPRVLAALEAVPREAFVPDHLRDAAYDDSPLPIGQGQTISQPYTVAYMLQAAAIEPDDRVLEVGAGSGYGAAVLGQVAGEVWSVERIPELAERAREILQRLGATNVHVLAESGIEGLPARAPFQAIVVTAAGKELPMPLVEQLDEGGRLIIPLGTHPHGQRLYRFTKQGDRLRIDDLGGFSFVPLVG